MSQNKMFKITILNPVGPAELLLSVLRPEVFAGAVDEIALLYDGNDVLVSTENGKEYRRYGRIVAEEL